MGGSAGAAILKNLLGKQADDFIESAVSSHYVTPKFKDFQAFAASKGLPDTVDLKQVHKVLDEFGWDNPSHYTDDTIEFAHDLIGISDGTKRGNDQVRKYLSENPLVNTPMGQSVDRNSILAGLMPPAKTTKEVSKTAAKKTSSKLSNETLSVAKQYLDQPAPAIEQLSDRYGIPYTAGDVPVASLSRRAEFQPRTTASGKGTENSVYTNGYNEGAVDQPMLVRRVGDKYEVLGGHSRTLGMERRAAEGLPNPESVKARIYDNITDEQARQISRAANQGGQYESTLDMAKSISDSMADGIAPSVQKQNMARGYSYDDYKYLWDTVSGDNILREKMFQGALPQEDILSIARHARTKGLDADKTMGIIRSLDANGTLDKRNARNVVNLLTGKIKAGIQADAQTGLFGDIDTAVNAVDLLQDFTNTSSELTRRVNAIKTVSKEEGLGDDVLKALEDSRTALEKKMRNISDEILDRYKARNAKLDLAKPVVDDEMAPITGQGGLFGDDVPAAPTPEPVAPKKTPSKKTAPIDNSPKRISVLKINDNTVSDNVPVSVKKYLPDLPDEALPQPQSTNVQQKQQGSPKRVALQLQAMEQSLPTPRQIRSMSDEQLQQALPTWRTALANIMAVAGFSDK